MSFRRRSEGLGRAKVACDACRHKKAKCDGLVPCTRCRDGRNDDICCYSRRIESSEQVFSALYVKMLRRQLHITLSSLRFLVERIALDKDCKVFVPELDTPINTVINLIHESSDFDQEQGQEFSEMSDSELTMLSPQEMPSQPWPEHETKGEETPSRQSTEHKVKEEPPAAKPAAGTHKRKASVHEHDEHPTKPTRGRPKKSRRISNSGAQTAVASKPAYNTEQRDTQVTHPQGDSTPLTPVSVRSDTGDDSPIRSTSFSSSFIPGSAESTGNDIAKTPLFSSPEFRPLSVPHVNPALSAMTMGPAIGEDNSFVPQLIDGPEEAHLISDPVGRPWEFAPRLPYETHSLSTNVSDLDYFPVDDSVPNWTMQAPPTMVSLNDLEYHMPE